MNKWLDSYITISHETTFFLKENSKKFKDHINTPKWRSLLRPLSLSREGNKILKHKVHVIMYQNRMKQR